jgi:predicted nucleotidyltransferase
METPLRQASGHNPLFPVRLRLDGLRTRMTRLDRDLSETLETVPDDLRGRLEALELEMGLRGVERGFEGVSKALCLALDGTLPDDEDWYPAALTQLARTGRGRAPALTPDLITRLLEVRETVPDVPVTDTGERLRLLRARRAAAREAWPLLEAAIRALEGPISPAPPDPDLIAAEPGRLERAAARRAAMERAADAVRAAFAERGRRAVPFGSVLDGPVHGRSDLDMVVPGEMGAEERNALWGLADEIAAAEGVELDLHFEHLYQDGFLDDLRTVRDGKVVTLRELVGAGPDQGPPGP